MKKLIALIVLLAAAGGGYYYYTAYGKPPEKPTVAKTAISRGDVTEAVQATGTLQALRTVNVGSQVSGVVQKLYADFNSIVKKGQIVAELDPSLLQVQVDLQNANVERQRGEIANQEVQLENDKKNAERTRQLFQKQLANQQQLDQAELQVKTRTTQLDSARKQLLTNEANLNQAQLNLGYTVIRSPIDGVVVNRIVDEGQTVQASMTAPQFFTLATDLRVLRLQAGVDEAEIGKISPGMPVTFQVDSYGAEQFRGEVMNIRLNAQNQNNVVTYPVWITAPNPDLKLRPSMTASLRIIVSTAPNVIRVPNSAIRFRPTSDMYTALGLTPPATPTRLGGPGGRGGQQADAAGAAAGAQPGRTGGGGANTAGAPGDAPRGQQAAAGQGQGQRRNGGAAGPEGAAGAGRRGGQPGQGQMAQGQGGEGRRGGRGDFANMTPEERERMRQQFAAGGGRGGRGGPGGGQPGGPGGGQGRGGRGQGAPPQQAMSTDPADLADDLAGLPALSAEKIDQLFAPVAKPNQRGQVWTWDEAGKKLEEHRLTLGVSDGTFTEMITGDLEVGTEVVTSITLPLTAAQRQQNSLFGNQQQGRGGNRGGMQPGGGPGGGGGGPQGGGGGFGGGGGGFGGGGGGGGRGGGF